MGAQASTASTSTCSLYTLEDVDERYCDLFMLPEIVQKVAIHLPFHIVRQYYCVCKTWHKALNCETFWRQYVFRNISFKPVKETSESFPLTYWFPENMTGYWNLGPGEEYAMFSEMPKYLKCGVVVPPRFDVLSVTKNFQDLAQAIWILRHMKKRTNEMECSVISFANEGNGAIIPVLIPWNKRSIPTIQQILDIFTIPRRMCTCDSFELQSRLTKYNYYHAFISSRYPEDFDCEDETPIWNTDCDGIMKKPESLASLLLDDTNNIDSRSQVKKFSQSEQETSQQYSAEKKEPEEHIKMRQARKWFGRIFQPSYECYAGESMCNPTIYFHLTSLGDGFVGGVLSQSYMT